MYDTTLDMGHRLSEILNRRPAVGLALGVVRGESLEYFHGHGLADIAAGTPITGDTVFRVASITKTFTAIAVMQLHERGELDLDLPADRYLRSYPLIPAQPGFRPATVRHLLTHTAGVPQMVHPSRSLLSGWFGESYALGEPVPTLAEYYRDGLRLMTEPGTAFTYTDHGFATLGQIVEDVTGQPLADYLRERVFGPLGMTDTDLVRSERVRSRLATGYILRAHGPKAVADRQWVTAAASSAYSTPRDMARYLAALLGGGANEHGSVLKPATLALMFEPNYQPHPRVPGMGLGFFRVDCGGRRAVEHQGILPGFNSQIFVAPDAGVGVMAFTNGARNALMWLPATMGRLLGDLIGAPDDVLRADIPHRPQIWGDICGWYRPYGQLADMQALTMAGAGVQVLVRRGVPWLRALSPVPALIRGFELHPDDEKDPYVFRIDLRELGIGTSRVMFDRDSGSLNLEFVPLTLRKKR